MRWFTCTPVDFGGGPDFFARDSGLLCRGLQAAGADCRAIMPGRPRPEDEPDLMRVEAARLEDPEWWRSLRPDGVVLYAWGRPKFRHVAAAIRTAGPFLVLNQDSGGLVSPLNGPLAWSREEHTLTGGGLPFLRRVVRGATVGLLLTDPLRANHLSQGDVIACVSPAAADHYRRLCRWYGGRSLASRVRVVPHPVHPGFHPHPGGKDPRTVIAVGRWDAIVQKRPALLMAGASRLLELDAGVRITIAGPTTSAMQGWHAELPPAGRERVTLTGRLDSGGIAALMAKAQVLWCPSSFESFHIASGEALCSGASVVAADRPSLASFRWFTGGDSGTLVPRGLDHAAGHSAAVLSELDAWENGRRSADEISSRWQPRLHAPEVARLVMALAAGS